MKIHLKDYVMEIPEEDEKLITGDDIDWCWNRLLTMTGVIVYSGRGSKYQILKNFWDIITKDLIDDSPATLVDLQGFKSWFFIHKEITMSSVFRKAMKDWYTTRFVNKEVSVELYNELVNGLKLIHHNIKTLDHRFDNWAFGTNGVPACIDFDGDDIDTIKLERRNGNET